MRKLVLGLLIAFFSTAAMADVSVTDLQKSVVNIETNKLGGHGSGTFIDPLHILTVWHVTQDIKPGTSLKIRTIDGQEFQTVGEFKTSELNDVGILSIDPTKPFTGPVAKIACGIVPPMTRLVNIGNPLQFDFVATNMYSTGGKLSPIGQKSMDDAWGPEDPKDPKASPKASPPDSIVPGNVGKKKKKTAKKKQPPKPPADSTLVQQDEKKRVFSDMMVVNGPVVGGMSGSALFNPVDGSIVGILHITFTADNGSLTGLGAAVQMEGEVCQWIKDQVGDGVFVNRP